MDGMVVVDDVLSAKAWQRVITICKASTVFNDVHTRGYLGAYACDGLHDRVLWEIARELRARLPSIFRCVGLETFWIYKVSFCVDCYSSSSAQKRVCVCVCVCVCFRTVASAR